MARQQAAFARACTAGIWPEASREEAGLLAEVRPEDLRAFAASLVHKRISELGHAFPETRERLGGEFGALAHEHIRRHGPRKTESIPEDALAFGLGLLRSPFLQGQSPKTRNTVRLEVARLKAGRPGTRLVFCWLKGGPGSKGLRLWLRPPGFRKMFYLAIGARGV